MSHTNNNIILTLDDLSLTDADRKTLTDRAGDDNADEVCTMLDAAEKVARPLAVYAVLAIDEKRTDSVVINGVEIKSALMRENFDSVNRVFPYVATCGPALEEWSETFRDDPLAEYFADEIKKIYLGKMAAHMNAHIKNRYGIKSNLSAMNPGSIRQWPLSGQRELFAILGRDYILEKIGVRLCDSMLMLPSKTVSGIGFESEKEYHNCMYCPISNCPNRRAESGFKV
jgi:hypothetical protein